MKQIKQFIKDIIPVILGILIALVINNWNEDRKEKKYLNQIFTSIENELEESRANIEESLVKQEMLRDSLEKYMSDEKVSILEILSKSNGLNGPTIKNSSWKAISNSKIELVEFKKLSHLTEIESSKEFFELQIEKAFDFLMANLRDTTYDKKEVMMVYLHGIMDTENDLKSEIDEFLKE